MLKLTTNKSIQIEYEAGWNLDQVSFCRKENIIKKNTLNFYGGHYKFLIHSNIF